MEALLPSETSQARLSSSAAQCPYLPSSHNRTLKSSSLKHGQDCCSNKLSHTNFCLSQGFYCFDKAPWPKATWGGKGLFHLTGHSSSSREARAETQGRNRWRGHGGVPFICLLFMAYLACFLNITSSGVVPPKSITNQENAPQACPQASLVGAFSQITLHVSSSYKTS